MHLRALAIAALALVLSSPTTALAHGGGLNSDGCHNNRKTGDYHCHRNYGRSARSSGSKGSAVVARDQPPAVWNNRRVRVVRVVDGDTLKVRDGNMRTTIRVLGIDCPESKANKKCLRLGKSECESKVSAGKKATARAKTLLRRAAVWVEGARKTDRYGRLLAYVRLSSGDDFGEVMLAEGLCADFSETFPHSRENAYRAAAKIGASATAAVASSRGGAFQISAAPPARGQLVVEPLQAGVVEPPLARLQKPIVPFSIEDDAAALKRKCGQQHGIWSASPEGCALPGGRRFRFVRDGGSALLTAVELQVPLGPGGRGVLSAQVATLLGDAPWRSEGWSLAIVESGGAERLMLRR